MKLFYYTYFVRLVYDVLIAQIRTLIGNIGANVTDFPVPKPTLAAFTNAIDELAALVASVEAGVVGAITARDAQRQIILGMLKTQLAYLESCCDGDRTIAAKLGIPLVKIRGSKPPMTGIGTPELFPGLTSGELIFQIKAVENREFYIFRLTPNPALPVSQWPSIVAKKGKQTFTVTPGVLYTGCVEAVGKDGQTICSTHITKWAA